MFLTELKNGIDNLFYCAEKLKLDKQIISNAAIYYHKFFETSSCNIDPNLISCACILIASKISNESIKNYELISEFSQTINQNNKKLDYNEYLKLNDTIIFCELTICKVLSFNFKIDLPHKYILNYLRSFTQWIFDDLNQQKKFSNFCWLLLNEFYKSKDCIKNFKPQEISITILQISLKVFEDELKLNENQNFQEILDQTLIFYPKCNLDKIEEIKLILAKIFNN